jgi:hypothetical protein
MCGELDRGSDCDGCAGDLALDQERAANARRTLAVHYIS